MKNVLLSMLMLSHISMHAIDFLVPEHLQKVVIDVSGQAKEASISCEYIDNLCKSIESKENPEFLDIYLGLTEVEQLLEWKRITLHDSATKLKDLQDYLQILSASRTACINSCAVFTNPPCPPPCPKCNNCKVPECFRYGGFCVSASGAVGQNSNEFFVTIEGTNASVKFIKPFCSVMAVVVSGDNVDNPAILVTTNGAASADTFYFTLPNPLAQACYNFLAVEIL